MEVFTLKQEDMGGVDPAVITHRLNVNPSFKPVKQKRRSFSSERQKAINEEVGKLLQAKAIREVEHLEWLANVVLVKKENGKWWLCIDFIDINKACPKDSFPLPRIDIIVDAMADHELLSFMNSSAGHGPQRPREDLICHWSGNLLLSSNALRAEERRSHLPKAGEQDVLETNWDIYRVYINDKLVKSIKAELHITHLAEAFQVLKIYNMKLNPAKCAFGDSAGKFLGFIVNNQGIKANPDKIKAVIDMLPPSNIKDIQSMTGRIVALSRFLSRANDKCQPFFQVLKKAFQWDAHYQKAFTALKTYLSSPPILVSPSEGELLTLYLAISDFATSAAMVREQDRVQQPVYYCS